MPLSLLRFGLFAFVLGCTAGRASVSGPGGGDGGGGTRQDGSFADCTGFGACASAGCEGEPCDLSGGICRAGECRVAESVCDDALDDDGDGLVDCDDSDCECLPRVEIGDVQSVMSFGEMGPNTATGACPSGEVLVGLAGRSADYLDQIQPICAPLVLARVSASRVQLQTGAHHVIETPGGPAGAPFEDHCPEHMIVTRISGDTGEWVDAVVARCEALYAERDADGWFIFGDGFDMLPRRGGTGGGTTMDITCTDGGFTQLDVDYGMYVDRVTAPCHTLRVAD